MEKNEKIDGTYGEIWVEISQPVFFSMRKRIVFNRKWNEFASHRHLRLCTVVTSINHASHTDQKHKNKDGKLRIILDAKKATDLGMSVVLTLGGCKKGCQNFLSSKITKKSENTRFTTESEDIMRACGIARWH